MKVTIKNFRSVMEPEGATRFLNNLYEEQREFTHAEERLIYQMNSWIEECWYRMDNFVPTHVNIETNIKVQVLYEDRIDLVFTHTNGRTCFVRPGAFHNEFMPIGGESELLKKMRELLDGITAEELSQVTNLVNQKLGKVIG